MRQYSYDAHSCELNFHQPMLEPWLQYVLASFNDKNFQTILQKNTLVHVMPFCKFLHIKV